MKWVIALILDLLSRLYQKNILKQKSIRFLHKFEIFIKLFFKPWHS